MTRLDGESRIEPDRSSRSGDDKRKRQATVWRSKYLVSGVVVGTSKSNNVLDLHRLIDEFQISGRLNRYYIHATNMCSHIACALPGRGMPLGIKIAPACCYSRRPRRKKTQFMHRLGILMPAQQSLPQQPNIYCQSALLLLPDKNYCLIKPSRLDSNENVGSSRPPSRKQKKLGTVYSHWFLGLDGLGLAAAAGPAPHGRRGQRFSAGGALRGVSVERPQTPTAPLRGVAGAVVPVSSSFSAGAGRTSSTGGSGGGSSGSQIAGDQSLVILERSSSRRLQKVGQTVVNDEKGSGCFCFFCTQVLRLLATCRC